jgi:hypothetical protein
MTGILRAAIRSGRLDAPEYRAYVEQLYHVERAAEGLPDGPELWHAVHYNDEGNPNALLEIH